MSDPLTPEQIHDRIEALCLFPYQTQEQQMEFYSQALQTCAALQSQLSIAVAQERERVHHLYEQHEFMESGVVVCRCGLVWDGAGDSQDQWQAHVREEASKVTVLDELRKLIGKWPTVEWETNRPIHRAGPAGVCADELAALLPKLETYVQQQADAAGYDNAQKSIAEAIERILEERNI